MGSFPDFCLSSQTHKFAGLSGLPDSESRNDRAELRHPKCPGEISHPSWSGFLSQPAVMGHLLVKHFGTKNRGSDEWKVAADVVEMPYPEWRGS